jgi:hypothetical protein
LKGNPSILEPKGNRDQAIPMQHSHDTILLGYVYHMQAEHIQGEEEAFPATHPRSGVYAYYSCWMR